MTTDPQPASAYDLVHADEVENLATFALLVDNEAGVLHRVVGLFAARGYNIESLTVAETDRKAHTSRITIVTRGAPHVLDQIEAQLSKVISVRRVHDVTRDPRGIERELPATRAASSGNWPWSRCAGPGLTASRPCACRTSSAPRWSTPRPRVSCSRSPARRQRSTASWN